MDESVLREISSQLSRIFRFLLPGLVALGTARLFHPCWFPHRIEVSNGWEAALIFAVAITIGSTWYVLHRYSVHHALDVFCYWLRHRSIRGYESWLYEHIAESFRLRRKDPEAFEHVEFGSAQVILLFIFDEALFLFAVVLPPDDSALLAKHACWRFLLWLALLAVCFWQYRISNGLDIDLVERLKASADLQQEDCLDLP